MPIVFVPLTQGEVATIDAEDWPLVSQFKWSAARRYNTVYAQTGRGSQRFGTFEIVLMHRLILSAPSGVMVDHRDRDGLNNRRANLRLATHTQNQLNRAANRTNQTGFKGVVQDKRVGRYRAEIRLENRRYFLGMYDMPEDAARAYDAKARVLHGEFAVLNFPD